jgi:hypothetical protein
LSRPRLPDSLSYVRIEGLQLADSSVDLLVERRAQNIHVEILRQSGRVDLVVND